MSRNEILIPEAQEAIVVDRFSDPQSMQSLVPGMEVTLAKRIIKPGSNRVMCLAARTSVPLSDDDVASVSNLALRLSDGTNVALSLSFFNDGAAANCIPLNRYAPLNHYYFDPHRYTVHTAAQTGSSLGVVLVATVVVAAAGLYYFLGNNLFKPQHSATSPKSALLLPGAVHQQPAVRKTGKPANATPGKASEPATKSSHNDSQPERENVWHMLGGKLGFLKPRFEPSHAKSQAAKSSPTIHTSQPRAPRGNFLVPPPPPMYIFPSQEIAPASQFVTPPNQFAPNQFNQFAPFAPAHQAPVHQAAPANPASLATPVHAAAIHEDLPAHQAPPAPQAAKENVEELPLRPSHTWVTGGNSSANSSAIAPVPGSDYPPLERIVIPPAQDSP